MYSSASQANRRADALGTERELVFEPAAAANTALAPGVVPSSARSASQSIQRSTTSHQACVCAAADAERRRERLERRPAAGQRLDVAGQRERIDGALVEQRVPDEAGVVGDRIVGRGERRRVVSDEHRRPSPPAPAARSMPHQLLAGLGVQLGMHRQHLLVLDQRLDRRERRRQGHVGDRAGRMRAASPPAGR